MLNPQDSKAQLRVLERAAGLILESNLSALKRESERRFRLLVLGDPALALPLVRHLSHEPAHQHEALTEAAGHTIHPWIKVHAIVHPEEIEDLADADLALLVVNHPDLKGEEITLLRGLQRASVPVLTVVVDPGFFAAPGRTEPERFETARVMLTTVASLRLIQRDLIPTLVREGRPDLRLALARQLPATRVPIVDQLVEETARANAIYAASSSMAELIPVLNLPFNAADLLVLSKNQLVMAYKIALAAGLRGQSREIMTEVVGVVGGGFLFRQVARQLVGLIPVVGIVPKVAVAYAGTWLIGRSVFLWATEGRRLDTREMRAFYGAMLGRGRALAKRLIGDLARRSRRRNAALGAPLETDATHPNPSVGMAHDVMDEMDDVPEIAAGAREREV